MGQLEISFTDRANDDLAKIIEYIGRANSEAALNLVDRLIGRAMTLTDKNAEHSGSKLKGRPGIRKLVEGRILIIYEVNTQRRNVRILRFWHGARDPRRLRLDK